MTGRHNRQLILCALVGTTVLSAADFSNYRGFQFGASLTTAAEQAGVAPSEAKLVHRRPAIIQELEWRPTSIHRTKAEDADPLREALLRFYNGELFQIVVTYERDKVEGMTDVDMVDAISATYGAATRPSAQVAYHSYYGETAPVIARWEDAEYSCNLVRTGDQTSYVFIQSLKRLDASAQAAIAEAVRLDAIEAPRRAIDLQKKEAADKLLTLQKARALNIPNFRP